MQTPQFHYPRLPSSEPCPPSNIIHESFEDARRFASEVKDRGSLREINVGSPHIDMDCTIIGICLRITGMKILQDCNQLRCMSLRKYFQSWEMFNNREHPSEAIDPAIGQLRAKFSNNGMTRQSCSNQAPPLRRNEAAARTQARRQRDPPQPSAC
jgi:hypothetical protein